MFLLEFIVVQLSQTHLSEVIAHAVMCCSIKKFSSQDFYSLASTCGCCVSSTACVFSFFFFFGFHKQQREGEVVFNARNLHGCM